MDRSTEALLTALLAKEGLQPRPGDLEQFAEIIELYVGNLQTLRGLELSVEEPAPVFHPEWSER
jgi:hypothetical protein